MACDSYKMKSGYKATATGKVTKVLALPRFAGPILARPTFSWTSIHNKSFVKKYRTLMNECMVVLIHIGV